MANSQALSDGAVVNPEDDLLERSAMSKDVAKLILSTQDKESLTVGIIGSWGSGKSTVLNFIRHFGTDATLLSDLAKDEPIIIEFNPWWYADKDDLFRLIIHG